MLDMPIEELDLPMRAYNSLKRNNIVKVGQLLQLSGRRPAAHAQLRQEVARRDEGAPAHARLPVPETESDGLDDVDADEAFDDDDEEE